MGKILLLILLNTVPNQENIEKDNQLQIEELEKKKEAMSKEKSAILPPPEPLKICAKNDKSQDCRHLTQSELSSGAVRGNKIVDDLNP